ncbi:hypothetical protein BHE74_00009768 [Ensete ventricosum]|nr:hypothetical protein BHE74_00009768 [Ensete ventricosum]
MAAELETLAAASVSRKRKPEHKTGKKPSKRVKQKASSMAAPKPRKPSRKMRKLFRKRAREYHSDEEEESDEDPSSEEEESDRDLDFVDDDGSGGSERDDEDGREGAQHGITRFVEGCRAFRIAFMKIMKKHVPDDPLVSGPILSAHKKLVAEKLAEEVSENKTKAEMKKEKQMVGAIGSPEAEKGHVKPATFLDAREKLLVSIATKGGIVLDSKEQGNIMLCLMDINHWFFTIAFRLLMQVSKAQSSQTGLNPSGSKNAKVMAKQRKQAFFSELQKPTTQAFVDIKVLCDLNGISTLPKYALVACLMKWSRLTVICFMQFCDSKSMDKNNELGWAPLRNNYMLTSSKLKDWDKMPEAAAVVDHKQVLSESSSDEE